MCVCVCVCVCCARACECMCIAHGVCGCGCEHARLLARTRATAQVGLLHLKCFNTYPTTSTSCIRKITSVSSGCELFLRFITLKIEASQEFAECKQQLVDSGNVFLQVGGKGRRTDRCIKV